MGMSVSDLNEVTILQTSDLLPVYDSSAAALRKCSLATLIAAVQNAVVATEATTARTLSQSDSGKHIRFTSSSASTATIQTNAISEIETGARIRLVRAGTGSLTVSPAGGVTVNSASGLSASAQFKQLELVKVAANEWDLVEL